MSGFSSALSRQGGRALEGLRMQKIDAAFLFELGDKMRRIRNIGQDTPFAAIYMYLETGIGAVDQIVNASIYTRQLRTPCKTAAIVLINRMQDMISEIVDTEDWEGAKFKAWEISQLHSLYTKFETLLLAEMQSAALYLVSPKGAFDTDTLIEQGEAVFTNDLWLKVPDAIPDLRQATRCISFELPTAAGFHLHRGHESVLRVYWDCVTGGAERPKENNMGVYPRELDKLDKGKASVRSHLRSIKDFHRNPLMHPEQSLETTDEAIDLLSAIRCSIGYMCQEIPQSADAPLLDQIAEEVAAEGVLADERQANEDAGD